MTNILPGELKLVAVYARVSTSNQEDQKTVEAQLTEVRSFAEKNGYTIVKEYVDEGWSGDIIARPSLDQLRHDARSKSWQALLVYDPDRLGRQLLYQQIVIDELKKIDIEVLFVTTPPIKNASDKLMFGVKGLFAEYEKTKITERFRIGKVNRVKNNLVLTSEAPFGYKYIPNQGKRGNVDYVAGHYEINETDAEVVRLIFKLVDEDGLTLRGLVRELQERKIMPRKSKRGVWSTSTLSTLLRNETYTGTAHWGSTYAVVPLNPKIVGGYKKVEKSSRRIKSKNDWYQISGVTPIIEKDVFERVGQRLKSNFALLGRNKKNDYLLAGKIWCSCGRRRVGEGLQKGKHLYYRCADRVNNFPLPRTCMESGISARIVDEIVWGRIKTILSTPELLLEQAERWLKERSTVKKEITPVINVNRVSNEIKKLKVQADRFMIAYSNKVFTLKKLSEYIDPINAEIATLEGKILKANSDQKSKDDISIPNEEEIVAFAKEAQAHLENLSFNAKKLIVTEIINKATANKEGVHVYGLINLNLFYVFYPSCGNCWFAKRWKVYFI